MQNIDDRRLIEDYLPIQAISTKASQARNPAVKLDHAKQEILAVRFEIAEVHTYAAKA